MFFKQKFKIFFDSGKVVETDDILTWINENFPGSEESFYYKMKWLCNYEKPPLWKYRYQNMYEANHFASTFYLYTSDNMMISPELWRGEYLKYKDVQIKKWRMITGRYPSMKWRHVHNKKSYSTIYNRHMETIAERRAVVGVVKEDGEPEFRGRRRNVPNPWDEIIGRRSLSWKDCTKRKRQRKGS